MLPELTPDELSLALDAVAAEVLQRWPAAEPPIDALRLARALGMDIAWDERQAGRGRTVRSGGQARAARGSILLRPDPRRERLQWTLAHEIGELAAHRVFERLSVDPREAPAAARETVANQLASRILLPRAGFERDARACDWDLPRLKARYATASHELIARRMLDCAPGVIVTVFDHGRRTFRRSNLPFRAPALGDVEHAAWRACHEQSLPCIETDHLLRVQAWPVHEADWKREILRAEWLGE